MPPRLHVGQWPFMNLVSNWHGAGKEKSPLDIRDRGEKYNENNVISTTK